MPKLINRLGEEYWFITALDGPWQVYSSWTDRIGALHQNWGIVNIKDGKKKNFGYSRPGSKANPFESARKEAEKRNAAERLRVSRQGFVGYNHQYIRQDIIRTLLDVTTMPGAPCYDLGVPGLVRRIDAINDAVGKLLRTLRDTDLFEGNDLGVPNEWFVMSGGDIDLR